MRKASILGFLALSLLVMAQERADAWLNFKFGAGVNWNWQSGGNNVFWGLFRNGQPPGCGGCDPSCMGGIGGGCTPFNMGCQQQQGGYMPQQCSPWMSQPQFGPQGMNSCPQTFPNNGHYNPSEFQFFGRENDPARSQSASAYNGSYNWQSGYYYPTSYSTSSYSPANYWYPYGYGSSSYYYPYNYGYGSSSYYYPSSSSTSYYYPSYQTSSPHSCYYNLYTNYNNSTH